MPVPRTFPPLALVALLVALVTLGACRDPAPITAPGATATPRRIVNGTPTGDDYPSVGALLFDFDGNGIIEPRERMCTGTLVARNVFLTAGHCILSPWTSAASQFGVTFAPDLRARDARVLRAHGAVVHPEYHHSSAHWNDLAVVVLDPADTEGMTPVALPPAGYLDGLAARGGLSKQLFVNVGYGTTASTTGKPAFWSDGKRRVSRSRFMALQPNWLGLLMNTHATGEGGDCYGDSGGPKFLDDNPMMIVATVTKGDVPCRATTWDWRLDTPGARAFLGRFVALP
jgi:hypothetical protein